MNQPYKNTEKEWIADLLQQCFDQNRSANYVIQQDKDRQKRLKRLMEYSYEICRAFGEVLINDDHSACALVLLPHRKRNNLFSIQQDLQLILRAISLRNVPKVLKRESRIKKHYPKKPFCYLWFIGVEPLAQGQGKGTQLLQQIIQKYEAQGLPIYLETSTEANLPWYEKMGFEIYQELDFGYPLYMLRMKSSR